MEERRRFGDPDYLGSWEDNTPGKFEMYVLNREWGRGREFIEGIILDHVGIAVFAGSIVDDYSNKRGSIRFQKTYSIAARARGGFEEIIFEGVTENGDEDFQGSYQVLGTEIKGSFRLQHLKTT